MEFLMGLWNFFNYNIFAKPAFFIGIIVFIGYSRFQHLNGLNEPETL